MKWDPYYPGAHWLMAEAYLAEGNREEAEREASVALDINPNSQEARSALRRARGMKDTAQQSVEELLTRGQKGRRTGHDEEGAQRRSRHAIRKARGQCASCHSALASIYEAERQYDKAITEWRIFLEQSPDRAAREEAQSRIESLKQKLHNQ